MEYDLEYFISKFEAIPDELWTTGQFIDGNNQCCKCAYGHCGLSNQKFNTDESWALDKLVQDSIIVINVNDGHNDYMHFGLTPKQRVVNYLKSLRTS